jgi:nonsense-mediated mRNA decay protein 3
MLFQCICLVAEITGAVYWKYPFISLCHPKQLTEYMVMNMEIIMDKDKRHISGHAQESSKVSSQSDIEYSVM